MVRNIGLTDWLANYWPKGLGSLLLGGLPGTSQGGGNWLRNSFTILFLILGFPWDWVWARDFSTHSLHGGGKRVNLNFQGLGFPGFIRGLSFLRKGLTRGKPGLK